MTTEDVLTLLRRKIDEADLETSDWTDEELMLALKDAAGELGMRKLLGFNLFVVGTDETDTDTWGFVPEPSVDQAHIVALKTAAMLVRQDYTSRLKRGAIGISWKSGLEEASTISAELAWRSTIRALESSLEEAVLIYRSPTAGHRKQ